jgi:hypothetical protein
MAAKHYLMRHMISWWLSEMVLEMLDFYSGLKSLITSEDVSTDSHGESPQVLQTILPSSSFKFIVSLARLDLMRKLWI